MKTIWLPIILFFSANAAELKDWDIIVDKPDLKVYRGIKQKNSVFPVKADFQSKYPVTDILAVLLDTKRKTSWVPKLSKLEVIKKISPTKWIEYAEIDVPWPCQDRDLIYEVELKTDENFQVVEAFFKSVQNEVVKNKKNIRAIVYPSRFVFTQENEKSRIVTESFIDPQGSIPKWVVNLFQKTQSVKLAKKLLKQLAKNYYKEFDKERLRLGPF